MLVQGTVTVREVSGISHELEIKDRFGVGYSFRRLYKEYSPGRYWERYIDQRAQWEQYGSPLVETLLDHMTKGK